MLDRPGPGGWPRVDRSFFDAERLAHGGFGAKFYDRLGVPDGANLGLGCGNPQAIA